MELAQQNECMRLSGCQNSTLLSALFVVYWLLVLVRVRMHLSVFRRAIAEINRSTHLCIIVQLNQVPARNMMHWPILPSLQESLGEMRN